MSYAHPSEEQLFHNIHPEAQRRVVESLRLADRKTDIAYNEFFKRRHLDDNGNWCDIVQCEHDGYGKTWTRMLRAKNSILYYICKSTVVYGT